MTEDEVLERSRQTGLAILSLAGIWASLSVRLLLMNFELTVRELGSSCEELFGESYGDTLRAGRWRA